MERLSEKASGGRNGGSARLEQLSAGAHDGDPVGRARELARGLRRFRAARQASPAPEELPQTLVEAIYLLQEAENQARPLVERLRILGLMATTLDHFFVAELASCQEGVAPKGVHGLPRERVEPIRDLLARASRLFHQDLLPHLRERGVRLAQPEALLPDQQAWLRGYFQEQVFPVITPLAVDPGRPFPFISSHSLNLLVELDVRGGRLHASQAYARIKVPRVIPRFVPVLGPVHRRTYVLSEALVRFFLADLFPALPVRAAYSFRVLRVDHCPEGILDPASLPRLMNRRRSSPVARLDVEAGMPVAWQRWLQSHLGASPSLSFELEPPLGMHCLVELVNSMEGWPLP